MGHVVAVFGQTIKSAPPPKNDTSMAQPPSKGLVDYLPHLFGFGAVGLLTASVFTTVSYASSADRFQELKDKMTLTTGMAIGGAILLAIATFLYYIQAREQAVLFQIVVTCISLGISLAALSVAAISR